MCFVWLCPPSLFVLVTHDSNVFCMVVLSLFVSAGQTSYQCVLHGCALPLFLCWSHMTRMCFAWLCPPLCLCLSHRITMCFAWLCPPSLFVLVTHDNDVFYIVVPPSLFALVTHDKNVFCIFVPSLVVCAGRT